IETNLLDWSCSDESPARHSLIFRGLIPVLYAGSARASHDESTEEAIEFATQQGKEKELCKTGDSVVALLRVGNASLIKILTVKWKMMLLAKSSLTIYIYSDPTAAEPCDIELEDKAREVAQLKTERQTYPQLKVNDAKRRLIGRLLRAWTIFKRWMQNCFQLQSLNAYSVLKLIPKNEYYDKTLQLPKEFDATTAWGRERFGSTDAANIFFYPSFRFGLIHLLSIWKLNLLKKLQGISKVASSSGNKLQETLTPKKLLILALQEAERNGNSIYIICLIRVENSEDEDHTSQVSTESLWLLQKRGSSQWNSIMSERSSIVPSSGFPSLIFLQVFTVSSFNSGHSTLGQLAFSYMPVKFKFLRARACTRTSPLNLAIEILKWSEERTNICVMYTLCPVLIKFFTNQCIHIKNKSN
ncbi:hypothetical protein IGI04_003392, partial [Brassica rapa subsp. trilocularis]